jgi:hypothetical protein
LVLLVVFSSVTARTNGVEPFEYLSKLFERLPAATTVETVEELLPWKFGAADNADATV